jgi:Glycosyltransferase family 87
VAALALGVQLVPLAAPLLLSTDAWTYWNYGRIAGVHDGNPYRDTPSDFPDDVSYQWTGEQWRDRTSIYAPGFTLASEPVAAAADTSEDAAAWLYKVLAGLAAAAMVLLASRVGSFATAFVGLNPVLAVHLAGGGHNDAWVGALVALALVAGATQTAGVAWALGAAVKWVPLVLLPLRALEARRIGWLGFATAALIVAVLATWQYDLSWLSAFGPLAENAEETTSFALPHRLSQLGVPEGLAIAAFAAAFVAAYAWLARAAWRGRARVALAAGLLLVCTPYVTPWYLAWVVPLAAIEDDRAARVLALALTAYLLPQTIPV